jgi:hypothetical protein
MKRPKVEFLTFGSGASDPNGPLARHGLSAPGPNSGSETTVSLEGSRPLEGVAGHESDTSSSGEDSC